MGFHWELTEKEVIGRRDQKDLPSGVQDHWRELSAAVGKTRKISWILYLYEIKALSHGGRGSKAWYSQEYQYQCGWWLGKRKIPSPYKTEAENSPRHRFHINQYHWSSLITGVWVEGAGNRSLESPKQDPLRIQGTVWVSWGGRTALVKVHRVQLRLSGSEQQRNFLPFPR